MSNTPTLLILYYSRHGATQKMAELISLGVNSVDGIEAKLRTVPSLHANNTDADSNSNAPPLVTRADLIHCSGLIVGSPTRFGNMTANLSHFFESTLDIWLSGQLIGKPAGVFTSSSTLHGGQESTLLSMILPLLHHGMVIAGLPYHHSALHNTQTGGTPYGPSHIAGTTNQNVLSNDERSLCLAFGKRMANLSLALCHDPANLSGTLR